MLNLLTVNEAIQLYLALAKKLDDPYSPDAMKRMVEDDSLKFNVWLCRCAINNAIESGELPAIKKAIGRVEEKKKFTAVGVPEDFQDRMPKQYEYWIAYSEFFAFIQRSDEVPTTEGYPHARASVARVAWMLANKAGLGNDSQKLFEELAQMASDLEVDRKTPELGDTTLKGCIKEIMAASLKPKKGKSK